MKSFTSVVLQGIRIHSKDHPDDPVRCFRGKGIIPATAEVLRLHLVQVDLRKYWDDMVPTATMAVTVGLTVDMTTPLVPFIFCGIPRPVDEASDLFTSSALVLILALCVLLSFSFVLGAVLGWHVQDGADTHGTHLQLQV